MSPRTLEQFFSQNSSLFDSTYVVCFEILYRLSVYFTLRGTQYDIRYIPDNKTLGMLPRGFLRTGQFCKKLKSFFFGQIFDLVTANERYEGAPKDFFS